MGVYLLTITTTRRLLTSGQYFELYRPIYCRCIGVLGLIGIISSIFLLFLLTLERYLVIVYSMRQERRISKKNLRFLLPTLWCLTVAMAIAPYVSTEISYGPDQMCMPQDARQFNYQIFLSVFEVCFDVLFAFLYIKIYLAVKKTRNDAGMQLDRRLTAKFGLIVLSNCILRILPVAVTGAIYMVPYFKKMTPKNYTTCTLSIVHFHLFRNQLMCESNHHCVENQTISLCNQSTVSKTIQNKPCSPQSN